MNWICERWPTFPCRLEFGFLCCFLWVNEAVMDILLVFVLYLYFRYMYVTMAAKCCECSWKSNDSMKTMNAC